MSDDLKDLTDPTDDKAWKRVAGAHLVEMRSDLKEIGRQTTATNGRLRRVEWFQASLLGGLLVVGAVVVPLFIEMVR